jgi:hypothetical protein
LTEINQNQTSHYSESSISGVYHDLVPATGDQARAPGGDSGAGPLGILPVETIKQVSMSSGWLLPGQGVPYASCGQFKTYEGCLAIDKHPDGKARIKRVHHTCYRLSCPVCMESAVTRASDRAVHRIESYLEAYPEAGKTLHLTISPPQVRSASYVNTRRKAARLLELAGISAGVMVYHPFRGSKTNPWHFSPHFHVIGFGWVQNTAPLNRKHGWVIKNIGVRKDPFRVLRYQLSHAGVHKVYHTLTYIGGLSGRRFKAPKMKVLTSVCDVCGGFMLPVKLEKPDPFKDQPSGLYWDSPEGWIFATHSLKDHRGSEVDPDEL